MAAVNYTPLAISCNKRAGLQAAYEHGIPIVVILSDGFIGAFPLDPEVLQERFTEWLRTYSEVRHGTGKQWNYRAQFYKRRLMHFVPALWMRQQNRKCQLHKDANPLSKKWSVSLSRKTEHLLVEANTNLSKSDM